MKDNKGFTLIEILISVLIIAIVFTMFSVIISTYYRQHIELGFRKSNRADAVSGAERTVAGSGTAPNVGSLKVSLSIPGEAGAVNIDCDISKQKYNSSNDPSEDSDNRYIYVYTKR